MAKSIFEQLGGTYEQQGIIFSPASQYPPRTNSP